MKITNNDKEYEVNNYEDFVKILPSIKNKDVTINNSKIYNIGVLVNSKNLESLSNIIKKCLDCEKSKCDCQKPYFLIRDYLVGMCNSLNKDHLKVCKSDCDPTTCDIFLKSVESEDDDTNKPSRIIINDLLFVIYTNMQFQHNPGENISEESKSNCITNAGMKVLEKEILKPTTLLKGIKILGKVYNIEVVRDVMFAAVECTECPGNVRSCRNCGKFKINLSRLYLKYLCKKDCNENCFNCGTIVNTSKLDTKLCNNIIVHMIDNLHNVFDTDIINLFKNYVLK